MPYTFAHPAAVLPLRRFFLESSAFAALVVGSMTPDFGYFVGAYEWAARAHSLLGLLTVCLPLGLLLYLLARVLFAPVTQLLPAPHRRALQTLKPLALPDSPKGWLVLLVALLVGAATHNAWDAFTHRTSWLARHWPLLRMPVLTIDRTTFEVTELLQHVSSVLGLGIVGVAYVRWLQRVRTAEPPSRGDGWRYLLLLLLALASLALALPLMLWNTGGDPVHPNLLFLITRYAIAATALFCGAITLVALLLWPLKR